VGARGSRMHETELIPTKRRSRRRRGRGAGMNPGRRRAILVWSAALSLATLVVIGLAIIFWLKPRLRSDSGVGPAIFSSDEADVRVVSKFPSPSREQALDLVKRAIANRNPEKVESLFRTGNASRAEVLEFFKSSEQRDGLIERYEWLSSMDVNGLLLEGVVVIYKGKEKRGERLALLTPDSVGNWKLDFEAFARTIRPSWQELLEKGAEQAVVRVFVGKDVYFNGPFGDDKEWSCYALVSPDIEDTLRGYCKIGSAEAAAMEKLLTEDRKFSRATLESRRVKDGEPRQFEITRVLAEDWVVADGGGDL